MPKKIKTGDRYICVICNKLFESKEKAIKCENGHDIVPVLFEREDLKRLIAILTTGNFDYMTEHLWKTLEPYDRL